MLRYCAVVSKVAHAPQGLISESWPYGKEVAVRFRTRKQILPGRLAAGSLTLNHETHVRIVLGHPTEYGAVPDRTVKWRD